MRGHWPFAIEVNSMPAVGQCDYLVGFRLPVSRSHEQTVQIERLRGSLVCWKIFSRIEQPF